MARHVGFEMQAVWCRDEMAGVTAFFRRLGPGVFRLGQVLFSVERYDVSNDRRAEAKLDGAHAEERVVIAIEDVVVIDPQP